VNDLTPGIAGQVILQGQISIGAGKTLLPSNHQAIEEGAVAPQGLAEVFGNS
jgi:hypothetical protein